MYYILRTYGKNDPYSVKENPIYTQKESYSYCSDKNSHFIFKKSNFNAEKLLNDHKVDTIHYFLYHIPSKKFVEYGEIKDIEHDSSTGKYSAIYTNRHNIDVRYVPFSSPNCSIIPIPKKRLDEIFGND